MISYAFPYCQWIGLREHLQEPPPIFPWKISDGCPVNFPSSQYIDIGNPHQSAEPSPHFSGSVLAACEGLWDLSLHLLRCM